MTTPSSNPETVLVEVCVESVEGALTAEAAGAHRIELCSGLDLGALTPSPGLLHETLARCGLPAVVMIRPRGGDFLYSEEEFAVMLRDVAAAVAAGAGGVALGILHADGRVDRERTAELVEAARPLPVTFHRAFDLTRDPMEALDAVVAAGVGAILTSGRAATAAEGAENLLALVQAAAGRLRVIAGGGVRADNAPGLVAATGVRELHLSAVVRRDGPMEFRNSNVRLGAERSPDEYSRRHTDPARIQALLAAVRR